MGIGGHILGPRKLRRLVKATGIPFDRAFNRNGDGGGRTIVDGKCQHYDIDFRSMEVVKLECARHWETCPRDARKD